MVWHEDFADEPSVEERMPFGITPEEMQAVMLEASLGTCEFCGEHVALEDLIETDTYEYYTMELDPGTLACPDCLENRRLRFVPDDPRLFDCMTPIGIQSSQNAGSLGPSFGALFVLVFFWGMIGILVHEGKSKIVKGIFDCLQLVVGNAPQLRGRGVERSIQFLKLRTIPLQCDLVALLRTTGNLGVQLV